LKSRSKRRWALPHGMAHWNGRPTPFRSTNGYNGKVTFKFPMSNNVLEFKRHPGNWPQPSLSMMSLSVASDLHFTTSQLGCYGVLATSCEKQAVCISSRPG
jgi:hypothetical protein